MAQLSWSQLVFTVANRLREGLDPYGPAIAPVGEVDIPYYTKAQIENSLAEISNQLLLEVTPEELQDSKAVVRIANVSSGSSFTNRLVRILSVTIRPNVSDTAYGPTQPMTPASYVQQQNANVNIVSGWTVFNDTINFIGARATVVGIEEVALATWQSTPDLLPDGYDEVRVDWVCKQLQIMNFMPKGQL